VRHTGSIPRLSSSPPSTSPVRCGFDSVNGLKKILAALDRHETAQAAKTIGRRQRGDRELAVVDVFRLISDEPVVRVIPDERIAFVGEAGKGGVVDPVLLNELELPLEIGVHTNTSPRARPSSCSTSSSGGPYERPVCCTRTATALTPDFLDAGRQLLAEVIEVRRPAVVVVARIAGGGR